MAIQTNTNYKVGTKDLSQFFSAYVSGTKADATSFKISDGTDLAAIFQPILSTTAISNIGYIVNNYSGVTGSNKDLSKIFEGLNLDFLQVSGAGTLSTKTIINERVTFIITAGSSGTLTTLRNCTLNFVVVGGGATTSSTVGGHGGGTVHGSLKLVTSVNYSFTIGVSNGNTTLSKTSSFTITAKGGIGQFGGGGGSVTGIDITPVITQATGSGGKGGSYSNHGGSNGESGTQIVNLNAYYGGGGGGVVYNGGMGGGGNGGQFPGYTGSPGLANTGGGGGGSTGGQTKLGGTGVIILYI